MTVRRVISLLKLVALLVALSSTVNLYTQRVAERSPEPVQPKYEQPYERPSPEEFGNAHTRLRKGLGEGELNKPLVDLSKDPFGGRSTTIHVLLPPSTPHEPSTVRELFNFNGELVKNRQADFSLRARQSIGFSEQLLEQVGLAAKRDSFPSDLMTITTAQSLLGDLGYYHGEVDGKAGPLTQAAVRNFVAREGHFSEDSLWQVALEEYASLSPTSRSQVASKAPEWLGRIGFPNGSQSPEDLLRRYQQFFYFAPTGELDSSTASALSNDLKMLDRVSAARDFSRWLGTTQESQLIQSCSDCFGHLSDSDLNYHLLRPDAPELWAIDQHGVVVSRLKGASAIEEFHRIGRQIAVNNSRDDALFLYAVPHTLASDSSFDVQIGSQNVSVTRAEFQAFLDGSSAPVQLTEALLISA